MTGRLEDVEPGPGRAYEAVTLSGLPVVVAVSPTGVAVNGQAAVLRTASACNGVVAVIDEVLIPLAAADDGGDPEPVAPDYGFDYEDFDYQFPFPVPDDGGGGQVPADVDCAPGDCCDVPPPPDAVTGVQYSCAEQVGFGKCGEAFMQGFCRLSVRDRPAAPLPFGPRLTNACSAAAASWGRARTRAARTWAMSTARCGPTRRTRTACRPCAPAGRSNEDGSSPSPYVMLCPLNLCSLEVSITQHRPRRKTPLPPTHGRHGSASHTRHAAPGQRELGSASGQRLGSTT